MFDGLHLLRQESINVPNRRLDMPLVVIAYRFEFSIEKALSAVTIAPEGKSCRIPKRLLEGLPGWEPPCALPNVRADGADSATQKGRSGKSNRR